VTDLSNHGSRDLTFYHETASGVKFKIPMGPAERTEDPNMLPTSGQTKNPARHLSEQGFATTWIPKPSQQQITNND
jgi:hypothetical protein